MSRQDVIRAQKRNQFQQRQQVNRLYAQRIAEGQTPAQAATSVVVADGDTLSTIAGANGTTEADLLAANPDLKQLKTGMVLSAPQQAMRGRSYGVNNAPGGIGLPSNAALGQTTNNPGGQVSMWGGTTPGYNTQLTPNTWQSNQTNIAGGNPYANYQYRPPVSGPLYVPPGLGRTPNTPAQPAAPATPAQPLAPATPPSLPSTYPGGFRRWVGKEMEQINDPNYTPNSVTLKYLEKLGLIKPIQQTAGGGYGGYSRRRGGGGGRGGGGRGPGKAFTQQAERMPAFSSGSGGFGLINWRI